MARSGREQYLQALASLSDLTKAQAERVAALLAKQGEVQSAQVGRVAEDLMRRTQKNREIMTRLVQREVKRQLGVLGMATRDEVARLHQRVRALEQELERASKASASTTDRRQGGVLQVEGRLGGLEGHQVDGGRHPAPRPPSPRPPGTAAARAPAPILATSSPLREVP